MDAITETFINLLVITCSMWNNKVLGYKSQQDIIKANETDEINDYQDYVYQLIQEGKHKQMLKNYIAETGIVSVKNIIGSIAFYGIDLRQNKPFIIQDGRLKVRFGNSKNNKELFKNAKGKSTVPDKIKTLARIVAILKDNPSQLLTIRLIADINTMEAHHKNGNRRQDTPKNVKLLQEQIHHNTHNRG